MWKWIEAVLRYSANVDVVPASPKNPMIGSKWRNKGEKGNPWQETYTVTVIDVKDGWVRYSFGYSSGWPDALSMANFLMIYEEM